jgi:hypothetical protein
MSRERVKILFGAVRRIGYGNKVDLEALLSELDPGGHYPNGTAEDLAIHLARAAGSHTLDWYLEDGDADTD